MKTAMTAMTRVLVLFALMILGCQPSDDAPPNFIFIMADDLGYLDLGCYGQSAITTPHLDQMAREGIRFTQFYAGAPVCAPSRSVLMTGQHTGHTTVRGNFGVGGVRGLGGKEGRIPLQQEDTTLAELLQAAGYVTAITGKWGLGEPGTTGLPNDQGFDHWLGYLNQNRAHSHYVDYIWQDRQKYFIPDNQGEVPRTYTHHLFTQFALEFIRSQSDSPVPFFLYIPYLLPHDEYTIPAENRHYQDRDWSEDAKVYASMIRLIDEDVGRIRATLAEAGLAENTLVFFTSDNGAAHRWEGSLNSCGELRGRKRDVYEGGIRTPMIVSMPGTVPQDVTNTSPAYFADILPTLADLAGVAPSKNIDGISLKQQILDNAPLDLTRPLYWEFANHDGKQALRLGDWKIVRRNVHRKGFHDDVELYNLVSDIGEMADVAEQHSDIVDSLLIHLNAAHVPSKEYPFDLERQ